MRIARPLALTLLLGWTVTWTAPLVLLAIGGGFCASCQCCDELFGGRVACVRGLETPPGLEMDCDDDPAPVSAVPPLIGKVRPGVLAATGATDRVLLVAGVQPIRSRVTHPAEPAPETPPPRS